MNKSEYPPPYPVDGPPMPNSGYGFSMPQPMMAPPSGEQYMQQPAYAPMMGPSPGDPYAQPPGYPPQMSSPYMQPQYDLPPPIMTQPPPVQTSHIHMMNVHQQVGPDSQQMTCPQCNAVITSRVDREPTSKTHIFALILCLLGCIPFCLCPYCCDSCHDSLHYCPACGTFLGRYKD